MPHKVTQLRTAIHRFSHHLKVFAAIVTSALWSVGIRLASYVGRSEGDVLRAEEIEEHCNYRGNRKGHERHGGKRFEPEEKPEEDRQVQQCANAVDDEIARPLTQDLLVLLSGEGVLPV